MAKRMVRIGLGLTAMVTCGAAPAVPKPDAIAGRWGAQPDGTFVNPIVPADYSDLDAIRVGDDFYAISSTLHLAPGMSVLRSRDLVNWRAVGHVVADMDKLSPEMNWDRMNRYGRGMWAGAIRFHGGKYWCYFGTPDEGLFVATAADPAGPWDQPRAVIAAPGWDDPCPFWDDDGQGYLVTSLFGADPKDGKKYNVHLFKLTPDGTGVVAGSDRVIHNSRGSEANKLYKINGLYYHYYSEVKPEGRVAMMNRAKSLDGPWETRQLQHVTKLDKNPNQGGLIELKDGTWWFVTHQGLGDWEGRAMCLLPVTWRDGWPIIGAPGADGIGNMVWQAKLPFPTHEAAALVPKPETFDAKELGPDWEWNHQPRADKWSLLERPGFLRLKAFRPLKPGDLMRAGDTLSRRSLRTSANQVTTRIEIGGMADGQSAGLCHFSRGYAWIGVMQANGARTLVFNEAGKPTTGPTVPGDAVWLRSTWGLDGKSRFAYSVDGKAYKSFGGEYQLGWGYYRGDRVGVFTYNDTGEAGQIDVDDFDYTFDFASAR